VAGETELTAVIFNHKMRFFRVREIMAGNTGNSSVHEPYAGSLQKFQWAEFDLTPWRRIWYEKHMRGIKTLIYSTIAGQLSLQAIMAIKAKSTVFRTVDRHVMV